MNPAGDDAYFVVLSVAAAMVIVMMQRSRVLTVLLLAGFTSVMCVSLRAETQPQTMEQEVRAVEQCWLENENRPDVVQTILADDFVHVLPVGFIGKDDHISYLRQHPNAFSGTKQFEQLRVRVYGEVAIATGIVSSVGDPNSQPRRTAFTDVFVRRGGKWLAVNAQELPFEPKPAP